MFRFLLLHTCVQVAHLGFTCDNCGKADFVGIRYHCPVCADYDLCALCERKINHEHPLLKCKDASDTQTLFTGLSASHSHPEHAHTVSAAPTTHSVAEMKTLPLSLPLTTHTETAHHHQAQYALSGQPLLQSAQGSAPSSHPTHTHNPTQPSQHMQQQAHVLAPTTSFNSQQPSMWSPYRFQGAPPQLQTPSFAAPHAQSYSPLFQQSPGPSFSQLVFSEAAHSAQLQSAQSTHMAQLQSMQFAATLDAQRHYYSHFPFPSQPR